MRAFAFLAVFATAASAQDVPLAVEVLAEGLGYPWSVEPLPDGRLLVTERPGRLRIVGDDGKLSSPFSGVPDVFAREQGGLLDVALSPRFESDRTIFLSYAEPGENGTAGTAVARARRSATGLEDVRVIWRQAPKVHCS